jgi:hypothetical protein
MAELSVSKQPRQHGESARRQGLVDKGFLTLERFDCGAAWQIVFAICSINDLRV